MASGPSCHPWLTGKPRQGHFVTISPKSGSGDFFEPRQCDVPEETWLLSPAGTALRVEGEQTGGGGHTAEPPDAPPAPTRGFHQHTSGHDSTL